MTRVETDDLFVDDHVAEPIEQPVRDGVSRAEPVGQEPSNVLEAEPDLAITEADLDRAIKNLCKVTAEVHRKYSFTTSLAKVQVSCNSPASLEVVWPIWQMAKEALRGKPEGEQVHLSLERKDDGAVASLRRIELSYRMQGGGGDGMLFNRCRVSGTEYVITVDPCLWKAVNS